MRHQNQAPKSYLIQTKIEASATALHALGAKEIGGIIVLDRATPTEFVAELMALQVSRLRMQPWICAIEEEQTMHTMSQDPVVVLGEAPPPTWSVFAHENPTEEQAYILWLLGADISDLSVSAFTLELTSVQVERLGALDWVKQVSPSVQPEGPARRA
jgi:hypothetical protein